MCASSSLSLWILGVNLSLSMSTAKGGRQSSGGTILQIPYCSPIFLKKNSKSIFYNICEALTSNETWIQLAFIFFGNFFLVFLICIFSDSKKKQTATKTLKPLISYFFSRRSFPKFIIITYYLINASNKYKKELKVYKKIGRSKNKHMFSRISSQISRRTIDHKHLLSTSLSLL